MKKPPARSILFLAATAEEKGRLGSDYFATLPTVPRENIGAANSTLDRVVERDAARLGWKVVPHPEPDELALVCNDQYSFVRQGIPSS